MRDCRMFKNQTAREKFDMGMFSMAGEFLDTVTGPASSLVKNVFMDTVHPVVGSVVRTDLAFGLASHTGIYVGENRIVEITEVEDEARVQIVTPRQFLDGGWTRTGAYVYVASEKFDNGDLYALGSQSIADRALAAVGPRGRYYAMCNNCHQFTRYCITGIDNEYSTPWTVDDIVEALKKRFRVDDVYWRSAGGVFAGYGS